MAKYSTPRILPQRGGLRLSDQQRKAATIWYNWYAGGGEIDYENLIIESLPNFWVRADAPTVDKAGNYTPAVVNSPTVVDEAINGQPAINLVASEQNGIHIGAVSNFTQFTAVCFFKCDDTSLNGLLFDCYSSASAFANNGFGIRTMSNQLQIILRKNGSNTQHNIAFTDTSSWHCLQVKLYTSSTTFRAVVKLDGVRVLEDLDTGIDTPVNEMRLGTDKNNSNNLSFDGLVTDWIFWKRATTRSEDAAIHGYFNKRYGTTFTLDNTDIAFNGFQAVDALTGRFNGLDVIERQDGKYNLVFSDLDGNIFFAEQGASLSSWTITKIVSDTLEIQSLKVWGRIEGRLVLVTAHKDSEEADDDTGKIMVHVADTIDDDGAYTSVSILTGRAYPQSLMLLNVDNDYNINPSGAKQLLLYSYQGTMSGHGGIRFLEFTGDDITDPSDWTETTIITHESAWWLAGFYDMDNSGVKSLVYSARNNRNSASVPGIYYIKPNGDIRNSWTQTTIVSTNADWLHVDVGNFFGNSSDVASIRSNTSTIYLFNKASNWAATEVTGSGSASFNVRKAAFTENGRDSLIHVVQGQSSYRAYWTGSTWFKQRLQSAGVHPFDNEILHIDLDKDGKVETIVDDSTDPAGHVYWFRLLEL